MEGKLCMVTGATSGIGYFTALELASMGAAVILIGRNEHKCEAAVQRICGMSGNSSVIYFIADLSSQVQIRSIADKFYSRYDHLDVLVNNAGGFFLRRKTGPDGIEMTIALNHLSYFLLTELLLKALNASTSARVINVSSGSHHHRTLDFEDLQMKRFYNPIEAYGRSKLMNILFSYELARRLEKTHITSNALAPGLVATEIWKKVNPLLTPFLYPTIRLIGKNSHEGAQTSIFLASSPAVEGVTGKYYVDRRSVSSDPITYDLNIAQKLWQVSSELVNG